MSSYLTAKHDIRSPNFSYQYKYNYQKSCDENDALV